MRLMPNKTITLFCIFAGVITIIISIKFSSPLFAAISSFFFFLSLLIHKFGYFIAPMITKMFKFSLKDDDYELTSDQSILIKRSKNGYYSTSYLNIELRDSSSFKSDEKKSLMMELFERAISSFSYIVKISLIICNLDLSDYIDKLEEKRSLAEYRRNQFASKNKKDSEVRKLDREIESYNSQIQMIKSGQKPMQILAYAQTTAFGITKEQSLSKVKSQQKEIIAVLSNALSAKISILSGSDLIRCFSYEQKTPTDKSALEDELF